MSNDLTPAHAAGIPIAYKGERVLTTERMAVGYGTDEKVIQNNFLRNQSRFVEGVHFFKVSGSDLKALKTDPLWEGQFDKRAAAVILWTERGARRHAKILDNDTAWAVFEDLEETYFAVKEGLISPPVAKASAPRISGALLREVMSFPDKLRASFPSLSETALQAAFSKLSGQVLGEPLIPLPKLEAQFYTASDIAAEHGVSVNRVGRLSNEAGIPRNETTGESRLSKSEHSAKQVEQWFWSPAGKALVDDAIRVWKSTQPSA
jgi:hypothetical protein